MFVESILQTKGEMVVTITPTETVGALVATLAKHNIGAVVVAADDGSVTGIISERDVVRHLARSSEGLLEKSIASLMTKAPTTCRKSDSLDDVLQKMTRGRFRHLPVVEDGKLVGLVSIGDVVKRKIEEAEQEAHALRDYIAS